MQRPANRILYLVGSAGGAVLFLVAWDGWYWLLRELGYVDGRPMSQVVSVLFLSCMLVMCIGYGVGIAVFVAKKFWPRTGRRTP